MHPAPSLGVVGAAPHARALLHEHVDHMLTLLHEHAVHEHELTHAASNPVSHRRARKVSSRAVLHHFTDTGRAHAKSHLLCPPA